MSLVTKMKKHHILIRKWFDLVNKPFIRVMFFTATCLLLVTAGIFLYPINPDNNPFTPSCSFFHLTHLYCPGCGMTRALHAVMHGRLWAAFSYNPLWPFLVCFVTGALWLWFSFLLTGKSPFHPVNLFLQKHPSFGWIVVSTLFLFWILRNIPVFPFTLLAPK